MLEFTRRWTLLVVLLSTSLISGQTTISVPDDYDTIQDAIDNAEDGDTIEVEAGLYVENVDFGGKTLALVGVDGAEETTILGVDETLGPDMRSVITLSGGEGAGTRIEGFTIALGSGFTVVNSLGATTNLGGGIYAIDASLEVHDCTLEDNSAGAIYALDSTLVVDSCVVRNNNGRSGIEAGQNTELELVHSTIEDNLGDLTGGGGLKLHADTTSTIEDCVFSGNSSFFAGAAVIVSDADIARTEFRENSGVSGAVLAGGSGGQSNITFTDCSFHGNNAAAGGAAILIDQSVCTLLRCSLYDNLGGQGGAFFTESSAELNLDRCTVANNTSLLGAGAIQIREMPDMATSTIRVTDSILWGNGIDPLDESAGSIDVTYSNIESSWPGVGNIDEDPLFVDPDNGDFSLEVDSPSIDSGDPVETDPDGTVRDQGAFYFPQAPFFLRGDADGNGVVSPLLDSLALLNWAFNGGLAPECEDAADVDDSGDISALTDSLALLLWGFGDQPPPPAPGPFECNLDPDPDADGIGCETEPECS